ncbi:hypothetical protein FA95DRAFT_579639 [Auriscalpium vulgare]|uniref:Uncharacterized protein n=1 Tax=Auriscalpium vulgare TaxID=40419 RepID=A0ACB8REV1_9AGAM|nr:hypothetical protein FA95DRAFT_579639 [Auriscalpium vulgare]
MTRARSLLLLIFSSHCPSDTNYACSLSYTLPDRSTLIRATLLELATLLDLLLLPRRLPHQHLHLPLHLRHHPNLLLLRLLRLVRVGPPAERRDGAFARLRVRIAARLRLLCATRLMSVPADGIRLLGRRGGLVDRLVGGGVITRGIVAGLMIC